MNKEIEIPNGYEARIDGNKVVFVPKESEDEKIRKNLIELLLNTPAQDIISHHLELNNVLAYLEKQKEQKPAEWSEEDEHYFQNLIMAVDFYFSDGNTKNWLQNRFKSLRPQPHWKPSEEQMEAILDAMIYATGNTLIYLNSLYEQLKAL